MDKYLWTKWNKQIEKIVVNSRENYDVEGEKK